MAPEFWYDVDRNGRRRRIKIDAQNHDEARDEFIDRYHFDPEKDHHKISGRGVNDTRGIDANNAESDKWNRFYEDQNNNSNSGSESSWGDIGGGFALLLGGMALVAFFMFLPYIIAFGAIALVCWGVYKLIKWIFK